MGILYCGTQRIAPVVIEGGGSSGKYQLLQRIKDDSNNEIGTVSGFFTDGNDVEYAVVCLDAQYRNNYTKWCSNQTAVVTNMPLCNNSLNVWWYDNAKETATQNTQLILDFCTANGYTSTACSHCRSKSFIIDGVTYYGQLPNMRELFDMWQHRVQIEQMDTSASSYSTTNFSSARSIWASNQYSNVGSWYLASNGHVNTVTKTTNYYACPILELPNT